ncbi:MAG: GDSL-type esterase/lipase family protein [Propionibacteriaceae bacterium]|nr:GDSL-type esterase/lipase family protein [Propionibacteriaceae bacterium]
MEVSARALDDLLGSGPVRWVLLGDSITEGWGLGQAHLGYAGVFAHHLRHRAGPVRARDAVRNGGVAGATVGEALWDFQARVARHEPDIVSILFGINDAAWGSARLDRFRSGLAQLVSRAIDLGALPVLQTPYPVGRGGEATHAALPAYVDAIRDIAHVTGAPLVDHFAHWVGLAERGEWYVDPSHVDERGHAELARLMIETLFPGADA